MSRYARVAHALYASPRELSWLIGFFVVGVVMLAAAVLGYTWVSRILFVVFMSALWKTRHWHRRVNAWRWRD